MVGSINEVVERAKEMGQSMVTASTYKETLRRLVAFHPAVERRGR